MPRARSIKRITNPDDSSQYFDVRVVDKLDLDHGSGSIFQRRKIEYTNHKKNESRKVEPKIITHKAVDKDGNLPPEDAGDVDDPSQTLTVELIKEVTMTHGSGRNYIKRIETLDHDEDTNGRKTHRVRLRKSFGWLDIERTDRFNLKHGSGRTFRREIISIDWDDDEFDNTQDLPLKVGPQDGFDPPWRLDPFQNIVNVKWRESEGEVTPTEFYAVASIGIGATSTGDGTVLATGSDQFNITPSNLHPWLPGVGHIPDEEVRARFTGFPPVEMHFDYHVHPDAGDPQYIHVALTTPSSNTVGVVLTDLWPGEDNLGTFFSATLQFTGTYTVPWEDGPDQVYAVTNIELHSPSIHSYTAILRFELM